MLLFLRRGGASIGASLTSPGLFVLLTASAVLIDFGSCATNVTHVVDVGDNNLTAYYPEVELIPKGDKKWHKVDPTKPLVKPILVRLNDGVFNLEFAASSNKAVSAVTLIDGFNRGCQFHIKCSKKDDAYYWSLSEKDPKAKDFTPIYKDYKDKSGTLRVEFDHKNITFWSAVDDKSRSTSPVKCVMSTQQHPDDSLSQSNQNVAAIELSTEVPAGEDKAAPLEVSWEMPIVRFASDESVPENVPTTPKHKNAAHGFTNIEITVAAIVVAQ
ncbi:hypothetical protein AAVH_08949 [Aphelenchoides avenae]|nr:hypothetical protein AAVH_08949 [Aphelenchus avenae]